jgi:hypothetical protein
VRSVLVSTSPRIPGYDREIAGDGVRFMRLVGVTEAQ